jgi:hypothetical protein
MPAREIYDGKAGTRFVNDTGKVLYQFIASLHNTCALCLQYHLKISFAWPIPMHYGCRCIQREIEPGEKAPFDFANYRELLAKMPHDQQVAAMGASNYKLLESGLVQWEDIVSENRVRDFREVVARKRLTVKEMTAHGVKKYQAEEAYRSVHTAAHQAAEQHRQQLLNNLTAAGMSQQALVRELSGRLAERVTLAPGPTGPYTAGPAWSGGTVPVPGHVEELAALLKAAKPPRKPKPPAAAPPAPKQEQPPPEWKPVMTAAEADAFTADSAVRETMEHVTSRSGAAAIEKEGFKLDVAEATGRVWGNGAYLSLDADTTNFYTLHSPGSTKLRVKANVQKVLDFDATGLSPGESGVREIAADGLKKYPEFKKIVKRIEGEDLSLLRELRKVRAENPKAFTGAREKEWLRQRGYRGGKIETDRAALTELLKAEGYDAIRITQRGAVSGSVGGNQLVVIDPKKVVVIRD